MSAMFYENYLNGLLKSMQDCQNLIDEDIEGGRGIPQYPHQP